MAQKARKPKSEDTVRAFLLHLYHREHRGKTTIYAIGKLESGETFGLVDDRDRPAFFVRASDQVETQKHTSSFPVALEDSTWTTMDGEPVVKVSCDRTSVLRKFADLLAQNGIRTYEADVTPTRQYLINRGLRRTVRITGPHRSGTGVDRVYINPELEPADWEPKLVVLALDIETNREATEVFAVSLVGTGPKRKHRTEEIHIVGKPSRKDPKNLTCHATEPDLLQAVADRIREMDPDILTGWNLVDFDLPVLQRRFDAHRLQFNLGRTRDESWYREGKTWGGSGMVVHGRQVMDALHLIRTTLQRYEDLRLGTVAKAILGRGKTLQAGDEEGMPEVIAKAYREDRQTFCEYCLEDSRLVRDILKAEGLIELSLRRSLLTGLPLDRAWGSVAAFEFLYMTELHKRQMVAPTVGVDQPDQVGAPGGLVMALQSGLYRNVLVFDFKSLYP
ncbi:MAG: DNA polymerase II, partial [Planctomycetes bacterium]|nr:DNA polymerase II [Planctomycetota bacterium]